VRGRALAVCPLHFTRLLGVRGDPTLVDARLLSGGERGVELAVAAGDGEVVGGDTAAEETAALFLRGAGTSARFPRAYAFALVMDSAEAVDRAVAHVSSSNVRIRRGKLEALASLGGAGGQPRP
jgi:hypothetical protein